jgi:phosphate transport system substrate-binding protein
LQNKMPVGLIRNRSGNYIRPTMESVSLAAQTDLPEDTRVSITDTDAGEGYPIGGFTWLILYQEQKYGGRSMEKAEELVKLAWWMIHDGQEFAEPLHYAPLPEGGVAKAEAILRSVTYGGKSVAAGLGLGPGADKD